MPKRVHTLEVLRLGGKAVRESHEQRAKRVSWSLFNIRSPQDQGAYAGIGVSVAIFRSAKAEGFIEAVLSYAQRLLSDTSAAAKRNRLPKNSCWLLRSRSFVDSRRNYFDRLEDQVTLEERGLLDRIVAICRILSARDHSRRSFNLTGCKRYFHHEEKNRKDQFHSWKLTRSLKNGGVMTIQTIRSSILKCHCCGSSLQVGQSADLMAPVFSFRCMWDWFAFVAPRSIVKRMRTRMRKGAKRYTIK